MNFYIETQIKLLHPICPHLTEEIWHNLGNKTFLSLESWPKYNEKKINLELDLAEALVNNTISDIRYVINLVKIEKPKQITLIISPKWKYELFSKVIAIMKSNKNPGDIIKEVMKTELRQYGNQIMKLIPKLIEKQPE